MSRKKERNQPYIYEFADRYIHVEKKCDNSRYTLKQNKEKKL